MPNTTPPAWKKPVLLKDGTRLLLRPINPQDDRRWVRYINRVSPEALYRRFMGMIPKVDEAYARRFTHIDYDNEMAIVGVVTDPEEPDGESIICVGRMVRLPKPTHAEVAFLVEDQWQGKGIGTALLQELIPFARAMDIEVLEAEVLAVNQEMIRIFQDTGFTITTSRQAEAVHIEFAFTDTELSLERRWERERQANVASIERLFRPRSVAVVGASNTPGTIGYAVMRNLIQQEFAGPVFPVNPKYDVVCSVPAYHSMGQIPINVDMAVIAVPAQQVAQVVRECAAKRVYSAVVISSGFAETGAEGQARQNEVLEVARANGMRIVGPNCLGLLNTETGVRLNASFAPVFPPQGNVALSSQSGALGIAILNEARRLRLGISQFIGVGNKADLSANDLLHFWAHDPATKVVLMYLESYGNPKKFNRIARRVSRSKPVVALKSGRSQAGQRAASSHTGALASSNVVSDVLMQQAGIVQVDSMGEFFNAAKVLSAQPIPAGNRVAILTNAGGPGILCADRGEHEGLSIPPLSEALQEQLRAKLPAAAGVGNPVDMTAGVGPDEYEHCMNLLLESSEFDSLVVMFIPPMVTRLEEIGRAMLKAKAAHPTDKPLLAVLMGEAEEQHIVDDLEAGGINTFRFPEEAMVALAKLERYGAWRNEEQGQSVHFADTDTEAARTIIESSTGTDPDAEPTWLPALQSYRLLEKYGIHTVRTEFAPNAAEAAALAESMGFPVVIKLASRAIVHKSEVKGVYLNLRSAWEVRGAFQELAERLESAGQREAMDGVLVQPMARPGLETVIGVSHAPTFGPVLMVGLGGVYLELFQDVQFALHPVTDLGVDKMLNALRSNRILSGYRGQARRDVPALKETLLRVSQLVEENPQVLELDLNPVILGAEGEGCTVVDARARVQAIDPFTEYVISQLNA